MILNAEQACTKLKVSRYALDKMIRDGVIKTVNKKEPNAKKFFPRFDSRELHEFSKSEAAQEIKPTRKVKNTKVDFPAKGLFTRLDEIESKLDRLLAMWS